MERQNYLVIPDAILPATLADPAVVFAGAVGVLERAAVQRHAQHHLITRYAVAGIVRNSLFGIEGRCIRVRVAMIQVRLVAGLGVPAASVVVGHEVDEVEVRLHLLEAQLLVVGGTRGCGNGQQEGRTGEVLRGEAVGVGVELGARRLQERNPVLRLGVVGWVLPVDVEAIEAKVLDELDGGGGEVGTAGGGPGEASRRVDKVAWSVGRLLSVYYAT